MVSIDLVYSIHDPTEAAIQKMIDASQRMIAVNIQVGGEAKEGYGINPAMKRHFELETQTLQKAPRDEDKLRELLKLKEKQNEQEATHIEDTQRLVTEEIEMLKIVLLLVSRKKQR